MEIGSSFNSLYGVAGYGGGGMRPPPAKALSAEQTTSINDILAAYDPENLSSNDINAINNSFREAGIQPSKELAGLLEDNGYDPQELRPEGAPPPPPAGGNQQPYFQLSDDQEETMLDILSQYDPSNLSQGDIQDIRQQMKDEQIPPSRQAFQLLEDQGYNSESFYQRPPPPPGQGGQLSADTYSMLLTFNSV